MPAGIIRLTPRRVSGLNPYTLGARVHPSRRSLRALKRKNKMAAWPYCGARQTARINRQIATGRLKPENGLSRAPQ
jgi:hypothetical protein